MAGCGSTRLLKYVETKRRKWKKKEMTKYRVRRHHCNQMD